jgi:hypothetical protein
VFPVGAAAGRDGAMVVCGCSIALGERSCRAGCFP